MPELKGRLKVDGKIVREALAGEKQLDDLERAFLESLDADLSDAARVGE